MPRAFDPYRIQQVKFLEKNNLEQKIFRWFGYIQNEQKISNEIFCCKISNLCYVQNMYKMTLRQRVLAVYMFGAATC